MKMHIFICKEMLSNIQANAHEIENTSTHLNEDNYKAFFIYSFALFESAITESIRHIFCGFPEKMHSDKGNEKYVSKTISEGYSGIFTPEKNLYSLVEEYIRGLQKGNARFILEKACKVACIPTCSDLARLDELSDIRNVLTHENTLSRQQYILGDKTDNKKTAFTLALCEDYIQFLLCTLTAYSASLKSKYNGYTRYKLIEDIWNSTFQTPLLKFSVCIYLRNDVFNENKHVIGINFEHLKRVSKSLASSEKLYLSTILQQYSCNANESIFKFSDIPSLASIYNREKISMLLFVFSVYPNLLNGQEIDGGKDFETPV